MQENKTYKVAEQLFTVKAEDSDFELMKKLRTVYGFRQFSWG